MKKITTLVFVAGWVAALLYTYNKNQIELTSATPSHVSALQ